MVVRFHTIIYQGAVEIENVPVLNCESCNHSEVLPEVKPELVGLIDQLGNSPDKSQLYFNDISEFARLFMEVLSKHKWDESAAAIVEERINELLDMMLLAQSLNDLDWMEDIRHRLVQLTAYSATSSDS